MRFEAVRWPRAIVGALVAEIGQVAATFVWVAVYSYLINPGQPVAVYEAHAGHAGPWVSIVAGAPIFYAASRLIARSLPSSLALFAVFLVVDVAILAASPSSWGTAPLALFAISYVTKCAACVLGGRHADAHSSVPVR